ncbi:MAG: tRNA(fMet)-specific endonuclease VapC [Thermoanaerobaculia bacterium]|jgi:tRNA(fMet)-specific endonuclease VapC|nr:tRNA(fMet)-specific endonuclease VapC [Thermoanaerobaculia bacterium]
MKKRLAVDSSAVIDLMREERDTPPQLHGKEYLVHLPLPVLGELYFGAFSSQRPEHNVSRLRRVTVPWPILRPDEETARIYAQLRLRVVGSGPIAPSKLNDFWIAAICVQHDLPLLTSDRGFDHIAGITVIRW